MKVLIGVDSFEFNKVIADFINGYNWERSSVFRIVHVIEPALMNESEVSFLPFLSELTESERKESYELVQDMAQRIKTARLDSAKIVTEVIEGHAADRLVQIAEEWHAELLLVGSHGRKGMTRFTLGSVSSAVGTLAPCSVLVLRIPKNELIKSTHDGSLTTVK